MMVAGEGAGPADALLRVAPTSIGSPRREVSGRGLAERGKAIRVRGMGLAGRSIARIAGDGPPILGWKVTVADVAVEVGHAEVAVPRWNTCMTWMRCVYRLRII